jgi:hypothetical protein
MILQEMAEHLNVYFITLVISGLLFIVFVLIYYPPSFLRSKVFPVSLRGSVTAVVLERLTGFLFFGVIPYLILRLSLPSFCWRDLGIVFPPPSWWLPSLFFWLTIVLLVSRVAGSPASLAQYPQMRRVTWTPAMVLLNAVTAFANLPGHEQDLAGALLRFALAEPLHHVALIGMGAPRQVVQNILMAQEQNLASLDRRLLERHFRQHGDRLPETYHWMRGWA